MVRDILSKTAKGVAAGILISIGCAVFVACVAAGHKNLGAILFSVALLSICYFSFSLYTGKIGFLLDNFNKDGISELLLGLLGNLIGTALCGLLIKIALPSLAETAVTMCEAKLTQTFVETLIRGCFCGVLMYVAVAVFKKNKTPIGILFAIPVFILSGFEHSIADIGYFAVAGVASIEAFAFIWTVILGNTIGALVLPALAKIWEKKDE